MAVDPLSPIAPARLRALLVPVGRIKRSRFLALAKRLQSYNVVRLGDVSPDGKPTDRVTRHAFSPLAFPTGMIIYDLDCSLPPASHVETSPFELFREPCVIIAIADGLELKGAAPQNNDDVLDARASGDHPAPEGFDELQEELNYLKTEHPKSILQHIFVFDYDGVENLIVGPERTIWIPNPQACRSTTIKTAMCDMTATLLWEMNKYAEFIRDMPMVESPKFTFSPSNSRRGTVVSSSPTPDKMQQRMTMPVQLPSRPLATPGGSEGSTGHLSGTESPVTFDDITRSMGIEKAASEKPQTSSRFTSPMGRERVSLGGAIPMTDKMKQRVKGRRIIVLGTVYLQTGRWPDALKELSEGAAIARTNNDYVWHAKALESILLCLLLFGWAGMDFQIPPIFYPMSEKSSHKSLLSTSSLSSDHCSANRLVSLQNLVNVLPDVANYILNLYMRATTITDDTVPQLIFSETVIRLSRILCAVHLRDGRLDDGALRHIILNDRIKLYRLPERPKDVISISKTDIASFLFRAIPSSQLDVTLPDSVTILAGMASVLSTLGMERKKTFVLREMFSLLVPGLVQARKVGAAEMGVHPAAGLQVLNSTPFDLNALDYGTGNMEQGIRSLLSVISGVYGVCGETRDTTSRSRRASHTAQQEKEPSPHDSVDSITSRILQDAYIRTVGDLRLKIDILRSCINFCEALPDFEGVLKFTVDLLRVINQAPMLIISPGAYNIPPALPREEQIRLLTNIQRTVSVAEKFGSIKLEAEYWDECLVRGIEVVQVSASKQLVKRTKADFGIVTSADEAVQDKKGKEPFIYNPFAKISGPKGGENLLIAGEPATFRVTLQNPFEFEVEIETLKIEGDGVALEGEAKNIMLAASCVQQKLITVTAKDSGTLAITGCVVKVKCCRQRRFPIFSKYWQPVSTQARKVKTSGLAAFHRSSLDQSSRPPSGAGAKLREDSGPLASTLEVKVLQPQPSASVKSTSLTQSALVILEGEAKDITITLENSSPCPVDYLFFTFQDSTTQRLQAAVHNKDLPSTDIYELEAQLLTHSPLRWKRGAENGEEDPDQNVLIPPHSKQTFTLEVFGKPGLFDAVVQIDYGCAGTKKISEMPDVFYSRRIAIPIAITVNASIEVVRCDILPFSGSFGWLVDQDGDSKSTEDSSEALRLTDYSKIISRSGKGEDSKLTPGGNDCCLMVLDLCNTWPAPITVQLDVLRDEDSDTAPLPPLSPVSLKPVVFKIGDVLPPGHVSRFVFPVPRLYISDPTKSIPSLSLHSKRQFVVSAHKVSYDTEVTARETFWYRERLIGLLNCSWKEGDLTRDRSHPWRNELERGRKGIVDMRNLKLLPRMIDSLRVDDLEIGFDVEVFSPGSNVTSDMNKSPNSTDVRESTDASQQQQRSLTSPHPADSSPPSSPLPSISRLSASSFRVPRAEFLTLKVFLQNNSPNMPIHPLLRLQPSVRNQPHTHALDLQRRLAWTGMLQQGLPILGPKEKTVVEVGITALCQGEFEIGASVEEIRILPPIQEQSNEEDNEKKEETIGIEDMSMIGGALRSRRIWHSRVPCVLLAS